MNFLKVWSRGKIFRRDYTVGPVGPVGPGPGTSIGKEGASGTVKESGGNMGWYATAREEGFFYNKQKEQMKKLKQTLKPEDSKKPPTQKQEK